MLLYQSQVLTLLLLQSLDLTNDCGLLLWWYGSVSEKFCSSAKPEFIKWYLNQRSNYGYVKCSLTPGPLWYDPININNSGGTVFI